MTTSEQSEETSRSLGDDQNSDASLETTVPTDLTISPLSEKHDPTKFRSTYTSNAGAVLDKKRLLHDLHLQKIEIAQKNHLIQNLRTELILKTEELGERLSDALREKEILKSRFEMQLKFAEESAKRRESTLKNDIKEILEKQRHLEEINAKLEEQIKNFKGSFNDVELSDAQIEALNAQNEGDLGLKSFVALKVSKLMQPLKQQAELEKQHSQVLQTELRKCTDEIVKLKQEISEKQTQYEQLREFKEKSDAEVQKLKSQIRHGDYAIENFDHVKQARDELEKSVAEITAKLKTTEAALHVTEEEKNDYKSDAGILQRRLSLVEQDCLMLKTQLSELSRQLRAERDRNSKLILNMESTKQSQEMTYSQYVNSRNKYKAEFELRLQQEIESVRRDMMQNFERMKNQSQLLYEQEIQSLREAKEMASIQKTQLEAKLQDTEAKYNETLSSSSRRVAELQSKIGELEKRLFISEAQLQDISKQYSSVNSLLSLTKQANLHNASQVAQKDNEIRKKTQDLQALQTQVNQLTVEREELLSTQAKLASDLKKILSHRDELKNLKQLVSTLCEKEKILTSSTKGSPGTKR